MLRTEVLEGNEKWKRSTRVWFNDTLRRIWSLCCGWGGPRFYLNGKKKRIQVMKVMNDNDE